MSDYVPSSPLGKSCISEETSGGATLVIGAEDGVETDSGYVAGDEASFASEESKSWGAGSCSEDSKEDNVGISDVLLPVSDAVAASTVAEQDLQEGIGDTDDANGTNDTAARIEEGEEETLQQIIEEGAAADGFAAGVKNLKRKRLFADFGGF